MMNALEQSLDRREIFLNYQPIVNSTTEEIVGFEALVRWKSKKGFISPATFIPLAENTGYIIELGDYIIEEACRFAKRIHEKNPDLYLSINISNKQLLNSEFSEKLIKTIDASGVKASQLAIEITESAVIENYEMAVLVLNELKKSGIQVYLDDFGTGYSSLNHVNQLPIDLIKIDKSFIDNLHTNKRDEVMVKHIINMADDFNLNVIAEGVEYQDQFALLQSLGAQMLQGYHFYRPLSEEDALSSIR